MEKVTVIGVAGGSASGKTTIVNELRKNFENDIVVLCHDYYYKSHTNLRLEERAKLNYDHPNAFDTNIMIDHLKALIKGETIKRPVYDYTIHDRSSEEVIVQAKKVIVVDGILVLDNQELRDLMDIKIFVETDDDERLVRRIRRDAIERGRSLESILDQYETTVKPMHDQFVEPSKKYADIIIPRGGENKIAIEMIVENIKKRI
ncbi:MAG: uridine kinase [Bacillota bacterium]|nr:uridine kinase [Bacillota bacterium]